MTFFGFHFGLFSRMRYITARPAQMLEAMIVSAVRETIFLITFVLDFTYSEIQMSHFWCLVSRSHGWFMIWFVVCRWQLLLASLWSTSFLIASLMATTPLTTLFRCTAMMVSNCVFILNEFDHFLSLLLIGEYHVLGAIWFQTPEQSVRSLFHDPPGSHRSKLSLNLV